MKNLFRPLLVLCLVALFAGCATRGYQHAGSTASALNRASDRVTRGTAQLDAALVTLAQLVDNPAPDLKPQFNQFSAAVNQVETFGRDLGRSTVAVQQQGAAYFQKWEEELATIQNADIREQSASRREAVVRQFERTKTAAEEVRARLSPVVSDLRDIQRALSADLTPAGVEAIRGSASKVGAKGVTAREALARLAAQFNETSAALSAGRPAPAK